MHYDKNRNPLKAGDEVLVRAVVLEAEHAGGMIHFATVEKDPRGIRHAFALHPSQVELVAEPEELVPDETLPLVPTLAPQGQEPAAAPQGEAGALQLAEGDPGAGEQAPQGGEANLQSSGENLQSPDGQPGGAEGHAPGDQQGGAPAAGSLT